MNNCKESDDVVVEADCHELVIKSKEGKELVRKVLTQNMRIDTEEIEARLDRAKERLTVWAKIINPLEELN